ncbi:histidine phosphatase family protein [Trichothermofontia sichuanensis B231]|uniref:histidine phosphatase family protein n=1 Tax=Trichothermofontia sichuanensis TaxID=3045816 RepID=UPI002245673B|nr:histidine phosphatase family protein [Trichothermofontia sichuanensis]UZQ55890.1 histidine phosphatase family protein [Trichothermofontia sichuanensis B231]
MRRYRTLATRVILVRHGQSSYNAQGRIQGRCDDSVVTEVGRATAQQVSVALGDLAIAHVYSSPLQRAYVTAEIIVSGLPAPQPPLTPTPGLLEIDLPAWEGQLRQDIQARFSEAYHTWKHAPDKFQMQGKEGQTVFPVLSLYEQATQFWQDVLPKHAGETIVIVAHNGINRALISTALGLPPRYYHAIQQSNCCVNVLNFAGGWGERVQLESMNLLAHLGIGLPKPRPEGDGPRLLLVRHGETEWNRQKRFQGQIDVELNATGLQQAQQVAAFLKATPIDEIITSPLLRPKQTAAAIHQYHPDVPFRLETGLLEISHGLWEGKLESEIRESYGELLRQWQTTPETVQMPAGENLHQVWERAATTWDQIVAQAAAHNQQKAGLTPWTTVVVAHDAVNKAILCHLFGLGPQAFWTFKQGNGCVSVIDYPHGAGEMPVLQAMNITSHLDGGLLDRTAAGAL